MPESEQPEVGGMHDPYDYVRPRLATFEWKNDRWRKNERSLPVTFVLG